MTREGSAPRDRLRLFRRIVVAVIIASFGIAALGGIVVLLGGSLGDDGWRVLSTTAVIGAFSIAVLCCAALAGRRLRVFGIIGAIVSVLSAGLVVWLIWYRGPFTPPFDALLELTWSGIALTVAFAFASLLLLLADRDQPAVRIGLVATLALFAIVLGLTLYAIWWSETIRGDTFGRVVGVFAILAALGAVIVPVVSLLLRAPRERPAATSSALSRLEAEAAQRGMTPDELLDQLLGQAPPPTPGMPTTPVDPR